jgi:hypothetical protein
MRKKQLQFLEDSSTRAKLPEWSHTGSFLINRTHNEIRGLLREEFKLGPRVRRLLTSLSWAHRVHFGRAGASPHARGGVSKNKIPNGSLKRLILGGHY